MPEQCEIRVVPSGSGATCAAILSTLPQWFGIAEADTHYVDSAERAECLVASLDGLDVGILQATRHNPLAAEIHLMAVTAQRRGAGVGTTLLRRIEDVLRAEDVVFLQVKTLSQRRPDESYASTRAFYRRRGFTPLEEFPELWGPQNPALQLVKTL